MKYVSTAKISEETGKRNKIDRMIQFLYLMYFITNPFYFWSSGLPQMSDIIMLISMSLFIVKTRFSIKIKGSQRVVLLLGLMLIVWITFVNLIWILRLQVADRFIFSTLFYIYNFLVFLYTLLLYNKYGQTFLKKIYMIILSSLFIQIIVYLVSGGFGGERQSSNFNNPNQLGYYALLSMSFLMFTTSKISIKIWTFLLGVVCSIVLILSSLSKASIVSMIFLISLYFFTSNVSKKEKRKIVILTLMISAFFSILYFNTEVIQDSELINSVQQRINRIGEDNDDNLEARGYYRIFEYPEYWLFGAGEGMYSRFRHQRIEFHSTLGNIQVSYGIVGTVCFIALIIQVLKKDKYRNWYILATLMIYGLTHNGIRNSLLWILMGLIATGENKVKRSFRI